jgi:hypothetical protein
MDRAIDLAIEGSSPYPERAAFVKRRLAGRRARDRAGP